MIPRALGARSAILLAIPALLFIALWPVARPIEGSGDTFQFWYAGHLVATGGSAYDQQAWHAAGAAYGPVAANVARNCADPGAAVCVWAYPPLTAWLFAPFGALPPEIGLLGLNVFVVLSAIGGVAAAVLVFGPADSASRALLVATAVVAHPFVFDIRAGHFVGLLLLGVSLVASGLRTGTTLPIVVGALVLALKPHVVLVVGLAVLVVLVSRRAWRGIAITGGSLFVVAGIALALSPEAIGAMAGRSGPKAAIAWATVWAFPAPVAVAVVAAGVAVAVVALRAVGGPVPVPVTATVAVAGALSLVVAPYAQPYDLLLALPVLALIWRIAADLSSAARRRVTAGASALFAAGTWAAIFAGQLSPALESAYALVPLSELALLALAARLRRATA